MSVFKSMALCDELNCMVRNGVLKKEGGKLTGNILEMPS
jgi:hypothetical protein